MLLFSVLVAFFFLMLAWASEIVGVFTSDETMVGLASWIWYPDGRITD